MRNTKGGTRMHLPSLQASSDFAQPSCLVRASKDLPKPVLGEIGRCAKGRLYSQSLLDSLAFLGFLATLFEKGGTPNHRISLTASLPPSTSYITRLFRCLLPDTCNLHTFLREGPTMLGTNL